MAEFTKAIVCRTIDFGEADLLAQVFTENLGRLTVFVRGARHSKKRFANALDTGTIFAGSFSKRKQAQTFELKRFEFLDVGLKWRHRLQPVLEHFMVFECLMKLIPEQDPDPLLFEKLETFLQEEDHYPLRAPLLLFWLGRHLGYLITDLDLIEKSAPTPKVRFLMDPTLGGFVPHTNGLIEAGVLRAFYKSAFGRMKPTNLSFNRLQLSQLWHGFAQLIEFVSGGEYRSRKFIHLLLEVTYGKAKTSRRPISRSHGKTA